MRLKSLVAADAPALRVGLITDGEEPINTGPEFGDRHGGVAEASRWEGLPVSASPRSESQPTLGLQADESGSTRIDLPDRRSGAGGTRRSRVPRQGFHGSVEWLPE